MSIIRPRDGENVIERLHRLEIALPVAAAFNHMTQKRSVLNWAKPVRAPVAPQMKCIYLRKGMLAGIKIAEIETPPIQKQIAKGKITMSGARYSGRNAARQRADDRADNTLQSA